MRRATFVLAVLVLAVGAVAPRAAAQIFTPSYLAPRLANEVGIYLSDGPGDMAVEGILRRNFGGTMLGGRLGVADIGDAQLSLGGEILSPFAVQAPLAVALSLAGQAVVGDVDAVGFALGLDVGGTVQTPGFAVTPYIHPRIGLINGFGAGDEFDLDLLADFGVNLDFRPGISVRLGVGISDYVADWGVGVAWRQ